jgi:hypothetical protein
MFSGGTSRFPQTQQESHVSGRKPTRIDPFCKSTLDAGAIVNFVARAVALLRLRSDGPFRYSVRFRS